MINNKAFTSRLQKLMEEHNLTASAFAEKIDVGRSSISHLVSGRNKPSLEIIMKILDEFPEVEFDWLVKGNGTFKKTEIKKSSDNSVASHENEDRAEKEQKPSPSIDNRKPSDGQDQGEIVKIIFFYKNGQFEIFQNN